MRKPVSKKEIRDRMKRGQYFIMENGTCMTYAVNKTFEMGLKKPKPSVLARGSKNPSR